MYVAVRRYEGVTDSRKVAQLVEEDFLPIISEMPGFVAYYCVDAGDGVMVSTSVFEHKDAEEQSTFRAGEFVAEDLERLSQQLGLNPVAAVPEESRNVRGRHRRERSAHRLDQRFARACLGSA